MRPLSEGHVRKAVKSLGDDVSLSRFVKVPGQRATHGKPKQRVLPGLGNPSIEAGRSIFHRKGVKAAGINPLVSGHSNVKIGRDVRKGHLRGYWIYTLSLEERATCPRSCAHWYDCYGNNMPFANRLKHGAELEAAIENQLTRLTATRGRRGILVRLHALGDFYSFEYVGFWWAMLRKFPTLAVFGYTAHRENSIRAAIDYMNDTWGARCMIRFSDAGEDEMSTVSIMKPEDCPSDAFVCPEQTGKTQACATCGACWGTTRNVAFLGH